MVLHLCSVNLTIPATDGNIAERQANRLTAPDGAILAAVAYGRPVMVLTDEDHAKTLYRISRQKRVLKLIDACKK